MVKNVNDNKRTFFTNNHPDVPIFFNTMKKVLELVTDAFTYKSRTDCPSLSVPDSEEYARNSTGDSSNSRNCNRTEPSDLNDLGYISEECSAISFDERPKRKYQIFEELKILNSEGLSEKKRDLPVKSSLGHFIDWKSFIKASESQWLTFLDEEDENAKKSSARNSNFNRTSHSVQRSALKRRHSCEIQEIRDGKVVDSISERIEDFKNTTLKHKWSPLNSSYVNNLRTITKLPHSSSMRRDVASSSNIQQLPNNSKWEHARAPRRVMRHSVKLCDDSNKSLLDPRLNPYRRKRKMNDPRNMTFQLLKWSRNPAILHEFKTSNTMWSRPKDSLVSSKVSTVKSNVWDPRLKHSKVFSKPYVSNLRKINGSSLKESVPDLVALPSPKILHHISSTVSSNRNDLSNISLSPILLDEPMDISPLSSPAESRDESFFRIPFKTSQATSPPTSSLENIDISSTTSPSTVSPNSNDLCNMSSSINPLERRKEISTSISPVERQYTSSKFPPKECEVTLPPTSPLKSIGVSSSKFSWKELKVTSPPTSLLETSDISSSKSISKTPKVTSPPTPPIENHNISSSLPLKECEATSSPTFSPENNISSYETECKAASPPTSPLKNNISSSKKRHNATSPPTSSIENNISSSETGCKATLPPTSPIENNISSSETGCMVTSPPTSPIENNISSSETGCKATLPPTSPLEISEISSSTSPTKKRRVTSPPIAPLQNHNILSCLPLKKRKATSLPTSLLKNNVSSSKKRSKVTSLPTSTTENDISSSKKGRKATSPPTSPIGNNISSSKKGRKATLPTKTLLKNNISSSKRGRKTTSPSTPPLKNTISSKKGRKTTSSTTSLLENNIPLSKKRRKVTSPKTPPLENSISSSKRGRKTTSPTEKNMTSSKKRRKATSPPTPPLKNNTLSKRGRKAISPPTPPLKNNTLSTRGRKAISPPTPPLKKITLSKRGRKAISPVTSLLENTDIVSTTSQSENNDISSTTSPSIKQINLSPTPLENRRTKRVPNSTDESFERALPFKKRKLLYDIASSMESDNNSSTNEASTLENHSSCKSINQSQDGTISTEKIGDTIGITKRSKNYVDEITVLHYFDKSQGDDNVNSPEASKISKINHNAESSICRGQPSDTVTFICSKKQLDSTRNDMEFLGDSVCKRWNSDVDGQISSSDAVTLSNKCDSLTTTSKCSKVNIRSSHSSIHDNLSDENSLSTEMSSDAKMQCSVSAHEINTKCSKVNICSWHSSIHDNLSEETSLSTEMSSDAKMQGSVSSHEINKVQTNDEGGDNLKQCGSVPDLQWKIWHEKYLQFLAKREKNKLVRNDTFCDEASYGAEQSDFNSHDSSEMSNVQTFEMQVNSVVSSESSRTEQSYPNSVDSSHISNRQSSEIQTKNSVVPLAASRTEQSDQNSRDSSDNSNISSILSSEIQTKNSVVQLASFGFKQSDPNNHDSSEISYFQSTEMQVVPLTASRTEQSDRNSQDSSDNSSGQCSDMQTKNSLVPLDSYFDKDSIVKIVHVCSHVEIGERVIIPVKLPFKLASKMSWRYYVNFLWTRASRLVSKEKIISNISLANALKLFLKHPFAKHLRRHSNRGLNGDLKFLILQAFKKYSSVSFAITREIVEIPARQNDKTFSISSSSVESSIVPINSVVECSTPSEPTTIEHLPELFSSVDSKSHHGDGMFDETAEETEINSDKFGVKDAKIEIQQTYEELNGNVSHDNSYHTPLNSAISCTSQKIPSEPYSNGDVYLSCRTFLPEEFGLNDSTSCCDIEMLDETEIESKKISSRVIFDSIKNRATSLNDSCNVDGISDGKETENKKNSSRVNLNSHPVLPKVSFSNDSSFCHDREMSDETNEEVESKKNPFVSFNSNSFFPKASSEDDSSFRCDSETDEVESEKNTNVHFNSNTFFSEVSSEYDSNFSYGSKTDEEIESKKNLHVNFTSNTLFPKVSSEDDSSFSYGSKTDEEVESKKNSHVNFNSNTYFPEVSSENDSSFGCDNETDEVESKKNSQAPMNSNTFFPEVSSEDDSSFDCDSETDEVESKKNTNVPLNSNAFFPEVSSDDNSSFGCDNEIDEVESNTNSQASFKSNTFFPEVSSEDDSSFGCDNGTDEEKSKKNSQVPLNSNTFFPEVSSEDISSFGYESDKFDEADEETESEENHSILSEASFADDSSSCYDSGISKETDKEIESGQVFPTSWLDLNFMREDFFQFPEVKYYFGFESRSNKSALVIVKEKGMTFPKLEYYIFKDSESELISQRSKNCPINSKTPLVDRYFAFHRCLIKAYKRLKSKYLCSKYFSNSTRSNIFHVSTKLEEYNTYGFIFTVENDFIVWNPSQIQCPNEKLNLHKDDVEQNKRPIPDIVKNLLRKFFPHNVEKEQNKKRKHRKVKLEQMKKFIPQKVEMERNKQPIPNNVEIEQNKQSIPQEIDMEQNKQPIPNVEIEQNKQSIPHEIDMEHNKQPTPNNVEIERNWQPLSNNFEIQQNTQPISHDVDMEQNRQHTPKNVEMEQKKKPIFYSFINAEQNKKLISYNKDPSQNKVPMPYAIYGKQNKILMSFSGLRLKQNEKPTRYMIYRERNKTLKSFTVYREPNKPIPYEVDSERIQELILNELDLVQNDQAIPCEVASNSPKEIDEVCNLIKASEITGNDEEFQKPTDDVVKCLDELCTEAENMCNKATKTSPRIFKSNCRFKTDKACSPEEMDAIFQDLDLFKEGGVLHKYYKHIQGFGDHTVDFDLIEKTEDDLEGKMLQSYRFLKEQLDYHNSLLRGLVDVASSSDMDNDRIIRDIVVQLDYIKGYEIACKAMLL